MSEAGTGADPEGPADVATRVTGTRSTRTRSLGAVTRVMLDDGSAVVVKTGATSAIAAEAAGLQWLRDAAGPGLAVPEVRGVEERWLVTAAVPDASSGTAEAAARAFGRGLAAMHAAGAPAFGSAPPGGPVDAWIGGAPMRNESGDDWPTWFAEHRIRPYLRAARDAGALDADGARRIDDVAVRLPDLAGPPEPPARLHGDLWTGNVLWAPVPGGGNDGDGAGDREGAWVVDPAAHGGHRESDLAMLALFGCPRLESVLAGYEETAPLADGWRARVGLHQLFPLLVHAVLFGGGYGRGALRACERFSGV